MVSHLQVVKAQGFVEGERPSRRAKNATRDVRRVILARVSTAGAQRANAPAAHILLTRHDLIREGKFPAGMAKLVRPKENPVESAGGNFMRFRTIVSLATFFLGCVPVGVWSQALPVSSNGSYAKLPGQNRSITGKISSVGDASFAIDVLKDKQQRQTMKFMVDDNTKVVGKLSVGARAVVEYRSDGDTNFAVHVVVKSSSGVRPY